MADFDLLRAAAMAAGHTVVRVDDNEEALLLDGYQEPWNPLTDDAAAFRLAVELRINIQHETSMSGPPFPPSISCGRFGDDEDCVPWAEEMLGNDPMAATRRAIVRAAANIGTALDPNSRLRQLSREVERYAAWAARRKVEKGEKP